MATTFSVLSLTFIFGRGIIQARVHMRGPAVGRVILGVLVVCGATGCQDVPPRLAPGFKPENLLRVSLGQPKREVLAVLGSPLPQKYPSRFEDRENLYYAERGARWWLGEYRSNVRGMECRVGIQDDKVVAIMMTADGAGPICFCNGASCPSGWLAPCLASTHP